MSFVAEGQEYVFNLAFIFLNNLEDVVRQYLKDVKAKVLHMKKVSSMQNESVLSPIIIYLFKLMRLPLVIMYYIYVMPFLVISKKIWIYVYLIVKIISRRSPQARHMFEHIKALVVICKSVVTKILSSKVTELIAFCITTIFEIIVAVLWPIESEEGHKELSMVLSVEELAELLEYEEMDENNLTTNNGTAETLQYPRTLRGMHHYVPSNPFKATIRIHRSVPTPHLPTKLRGVSTDLVPHDINPGSCLVDYNGADSPASFPPTPYSRAHVMNRSLDRVASVMFAARDRLRLEAQSVSRDEYSRIVAKEAQTSGQFAVFDPKESSPGVALSCGNHCAIKVGKGLCCCCRAMMPVHLDTYVYFEFSVMVSSAQTPTLGIGLSPECPMNVMVGSWPRSKGFYNDGQMLIGSHWYQCTNDKKIEAGSTVGMLVYIPSQHEPEIPEDIFGEEEDLPETKSQSFFESFMSGFSRSDSSDRDESFIGLALSSGDESSGPHSRNNSKKNSPDKTRGKHLGPTAEPYNSVSNNTIHTMHSSNTTTTNNPQPVKNPPIFQFTVNGQPVLHPEEANLSHQDLTAMDANLSMYGNRAVPSAGNGGAGGSAPALYPTVSLFSEETRVWCRFCEADVIYKSRAAIGAPPGVKVYCLDGSLLLQESD